MTTTRKRGAETSSTPPTVAIRRFHRPWNAATMSSVIAAPMSRASKSSSHSSRSYRTQSGDRSRNSENGVLLTKTIAVYCPSVARTLTPNATIPIGVIFVFRAEVEFEIPDSCIPFTLFLVFVIPTAITRCGSKTTTAAARRSSELFGLTGGLWLSARCRLEVGLCPERHDFRIGGSFSVLRVVVGPD